MSEPLQGLPALSRAPASRHIKPVDNTQHIQGIEVTYVIVQRAAAQHMQRFFARYNRSCHQQPGSDSAGSRPMSHALLEGNKLSY